MRRERLSQGSCGRYGRLECGMLMPQIVVGCRDGLNRRLRMRTGPSMFRRLVTGIAMQRSMLKLPRGLGEACREEER